MGTTENQRQWLLGQLNRHTYKPGWQFEIAGSIGHWVLYGRCKVLNSRDPGGMAADFVSQQMIPFHVVDDRDEDGFTRTWNILIDRAEAHESAEWRRKDQLVIDDPHRSDPNYKPAPPISREAIEQAAGRITPRASARSYSRWGEDWPSFVDEINVYAQSGPIDLDPNPDAWKRIGAIDPADIAKVMRRANT